MALSALQVALTKLSLQAGEAVLNQVGWLEGLAAVVGGLDGAVAVVQVAPAKAGAAGAGADAVRGLEGALVAAGGPALGGRHEAVEGRGYQLSQVHEESDH